MNGNRQLEERLKRLAVPVDPSGVWDVIEGRAQKDKRASRERWPLTAGVDERVGGQKRSSAPREASAPRASTPRRRSGLRIAVFASIAVVLVAAVALGGLEAFKYLAKPDFVLRITDDTDIDTGGQPTGNDAQSGYWERLPLARSDVPVQTLVMDPSNTSVLYAQTAAGLYKSSDGAASWDQTLSFSAFAGQVFVVAFDPASPSTVYMIAWLSGGSPGLPQLLRSDDGGATWAHLTDASTPRLNGYFEAISFDTAFTPSTVFMFGNDRWCRSTDRGGTWTGLTEEEADQAIGAPGADNLRQHAYRDGVSSLPAAAQQALDAFLASFDGTVTDADTGAVVGVVPGNNGLPGGVSASDGARAESVIVDPDQPSILYAPTMEGVYKSTDGGRSWRKASTGSRGSGDQKICSRSAYSLDSLRRHDRRHLSIHRWRNRVDPDPGGRGLRGPGALDSIETLRLDLHWTVPSDDGGEKWAGLTGEGLSGPTASALLSVAADNPDIVFATPRWRRA